MGLGKPAGIPGDDVNKRQDVAKRENRHCVTQEAVSAKPNSIPQMALHPSRIWLGSIFPCPKAVLHLGLFWSCWLVCRMNAVHTFWNDVVSQLLLSGLLFQNTPQSSGSDSTANEGFLLFQVWEWRREVLNSPQTWACRKFSFFTTHPALYPSKIRV